MLIDKAHILVLKLHKHLANKGANVFVHCLYSSQALFDNLLEVLIFGNALQLVLNRLIVYFHTFVAMLDDVRKETRIEGESEMYVSVLLEALLA